MSEMTCMDRVLTALSHKEPDRVPMFLFLTMHGAKMLNLGLSQYFSKAENVAEGQWRLHRKYGSDCLYPIFYAALEVEGWGGEVIEYADGPANAGAPIIKEHGDIRTIEPPEVNASPRLMEYLKAIRLCKERAGNDVPIVGVVISPFSVPVMQMGFESYLNLMLDEKPLFWELMRKNQRFCIEFANMQLEAGATAICYFDPISSTTIITPDQYREMGKKVAHDTISRIKGATITHLASGRCAPILDDIAETGTAGVGVSTNEDLAELKSICKGKMTVIGNMNGIEMRRWSTDTVNMKVKESIDKAAKGGGFILADNHGEIPFQVPDRVLRDISQALKRYGGYPIE